MIFKIEAGKMYRDNLLYCHRFRIGNKLSGTFQFRSGAYYGSKKNIATNKIVGLSDSFWHMDSSVRIGYRWNLGEGCLELRCLRHVFGRRISEHLMFIKPMDTWKVMWFSIEIERDKYIIKINDREFKFSRKSKFIGLRYVLFPYVEPVIGVDTIININLD